MNENLPMKEEKGLFQKIKIFFRNLFYKPQEFENIEIEKDKKEIVDISNEEFHNLIKVEVDNNFQKEIQRKNLFEKIRKNQEVLNSLSNKQLEEISKYYDKVIEKNDEIIKLKKLQIVKLKKLDSI